MRKHTIQEVRQVFADAGCVLLANAYEGQKIPMPFICVCKRKGMIDYNKFQQGRRCKQCGEESKSRKLLTPFSVVQETFEDAGCVLLETEYHGNKLPLKFICSCKNETTISYDYFCTRIKEDVSCPCENGNKVPRYTEEDVRRKLEEEGCKYLGGFVAASKDMDYICSCGHEAKVKFSMFLQGYRCRFCRDKRAADARRGQFTGGVCQECKERPVGAATDLGLCDACAKKRNSTRECTNCNKVKPWVQNGLCQTCDYKINIKPHPKKCSSCGEVKIITKCKGLCQKCYNRKYPSLKECSACGEMKPRFCKNMCVRCYRRLNVSIIGKRHTPPLRQCQDCKRHLYQYLSKGLCNKCRYKNTPMKECSRCGRMKKIMGSTCTQCSQGKRVGRMVKCLGCEKEKIHYAHGLCHSCYEGERQKRA